MAGIIVEYPVTSTALLAATAKTVCQVTAPTNQRLKVIGFGFYTDGVAPTAVPVQLRILRQTTAGTGSAITAAIAEQGLTETVQSSALGNHSAEPTAGAVLRVISIPVFMGQYEISLPAGQEIYIGGAGRLGFEMNAPAAVNVRGFVRVEE
jgi:hypothetical protein